MLRSSSSYVSFGRMSFRESVYPRAVTLTARRLPSERRVLSKPEVVVKVIRFWEGRVRFCSRQTAPRADVQKRESLRSLNTVIEM